MNCWTNTVRGAQASAVIYSITETARANGLNVYYYIKYLLEQLAELIDGQGNMEQSEPEPLMPWSKTCREGVRFDAYISQRIAVHILLIWL